MKCPNCNHIFAASLSDLASELGCTKSKKKADAARRNGKKGGRPRKQNDREQ